MLDKAQQTIILDHLNGRLSQVPLDDCGFCQVADALWKKTPEYVDERLYPCRESYCKVCPLDHRKQGETCINIRKKHLVDTFDGSETTDYEDAEINSIGLHVDFLMDQAIKYWKIPFSYDHKSGETKIIIREDKNADSRAG